MDLDLFGSSWPNMLNSHLGRQNSHLFGQYIRGENSLLFWFYLTAKILSFWDILTANSFMGHLR